MRWKKIAIGVGTTAAIVIPASLLISIAATPRPPTASNQYLLNFVSDADLKKVLKNPSIWATLTAKEKRMYASQQFINQSIELVNMVLNEYAKTNKSPYWNLEFTTLNSSPTNDELNFFQELTKAILYISQGRINFQLVPRTPSSVNQGFNNKDQQMISWYWSPDYNGLGTWLGYNFAPDFIVPNMWPWLCAQLQNAQKKSTNSSATWQASLATYLANVDISTYYYIKNVKDPVHINFKLGVIAQAVQNKLTTIEQVKNLTIQPFSSESAPLVPSISQMYDFVDKFQIKGTDEIYASIQNAVAAWSMKPENNQPTGTFDKNGKIQNYVPSKVIELINVLNYNPNMIPYIGDGPNSKNPKLVRFGANAPENPNSFFNTRDWFLQADKQGKYPFDKDTFSWQAKSDPFAQNITAWNPTFTENTSPLGKPTFVNLFSWTTVNNPTDKIIETELVAEGTTETANFENQVNIIINWLDAGGVLPHTIPNSAKPIDGTNVYNISLDDIVIGNKTIPAPKNFVFIKDNNNYIPRWKFDFPIRPIQWVDSQGKLIKDEYLSPRDFWAGWKSYKLACDGGLSHNSYFINMLGVDMNTTIDYGQAMINKNQYINNSKTDINDPSKWSTFSMFMNNPTLPGKTCEDILTNQYFAALPYSNPKVQNIVNSEKNVIVYTNGKNEGEKKIDKERTFSGNKIYGSGLATESYKDLWYVSPYIVSNCDQSSFTLKLNEIYFKYFEKEAKAISTPNHLNKYLQFNLKTKAPFGDNGNKVEIKKIPNINVSYLSYNIKTTFDQFKNGARDMAEIPSDEMSSLGVSINSNQNQTSINPLTKDIYSPLVAQENKTNLIPYNTNVFTTTTTKQGINVYQAQLTEIGKQKNIDVSKWGVVPKSIDKYGNVISWRPIALDKNNHNLGPIPNFKDLAPILKEHIPIQYFDLIVKNYNSNAKMSDLINVFINKKGSRGSVINGQAIKGPQDILNFSSIIIRNTINNAINWLKMADICFPNNNKSPQLSFIPYGVFNTNIDEPQNVKWKYYNLAWEKPYDNIDWKKIQNLRDGVNEISNRNGGILKFTNEDYILASSTFINK